VNKLLSEILENTEIIKENTTKPKKTKKEKKEMTPQQKASAKFKRVGTQLNENELKLFEDHLFLLDTNANAYIKKLIFNDINKKPLLHRITQFLRL